MKMCKGSAKQGLIWYSVATVLTLFVIYGQSMLSGESSGGLSAAVVAFLKPLIDPNDLINTDSMHFFIRKAGHFIEYFLLGIFVCGAAIHYGRMKDRNYIALPVLVTLMVAVSDEFLQRFTGRGSAVTDVVLDFSGALTGLGIMALIRYLKQRRGKHET